MFSSIVYNLDGLEFLGSPCRPLKILNYNQHSLHRNVRVEKHPKKNERMRKLLVQALFYNQYSPHRNVRVEKHPKKNKLMRKFMHCFPTIAHSFTDLVKAKHVLR